MHRWAILEPWALDCRLMWERNEFEEEERPARSDAVVGFVKRATAVVLLGFVFFIGSGQQAQAQRPVVLLFHGGGLVFGDVGLVDILKPAVRAAGMQPVPVDYTLGSFPHAFADAEAAARRYRGRTVFAYGESSGGTLAGWLAARRLVRAAAGNSAVVNMTRFLRPLTTSHVLIDLPQLPEPITVAELINKIDGGPAFVYQHSLQHLSGAPLRLYCNSFDTTVPCQVSQGYAKHYRSVSWRRAGVGHVTARVPTITRALAWMRRTVDRQGPRRN